MFQTALGQSMSFKFTLMKHGTISLTIITSCHDSMSTILILKCKELLFKLLKGLKSFFQTLFFFLKYSLTHPSTSLFYFFFFSAPTSHVQPPARGTCMRVKKKNYNVHFLFIFNFRPERSLKKKKII